jgi:hypothetical protein
LRGRFDGAVAQRLGKESPDGSSPPSAVSPAAMAPSPANQTGMPDSLKAGIESLSGMDMSGVRVHRDSDRPAQLNALAYAQGTDIHLAPGQEQHLPHEAWHVVQQAQGRVKPTRQMQGPQGVAINDDAGLEREADTMGAQAAASGVAQAAGRDRQTATAPPNGMVVQRAVGYEFETGWFVDNIPIEGHGNDDDLEPRKPEPFAKKEVVSSATFPGFRMEADEAEGGRSEIEFVVRPPLDESLAGLKQLEGVMGAMVEVGLGLKANYNGDEKPFPLRLVTSNGLDEYTLVTPRKGDAELKAGQQATTGLDLSAVPEMVKVKLAQPPKDAPKFLGFLTLVRQYMERGTSLGGGALSYPKIIAEPLLARTNFVKLFKLVEPEVQQHYGVTHPELWVKDVLDKIGLPDIADVDVLARGVVADGDMEAHTDLRVQLMNTTDKLQQTLDRLAKISLALDQTTTRIVDYKEGFFEDAGRKLRGDPNKAELENRHGTLVNDKLAMSNERAQLNLQKTQLEQRKLALEQYAGFTVRQWLDGPLADQDLLSTIKDAESLGEFGERTEKVGAEGEERDAGIFEFRGAQTNKIPVTEWPTFALRFFQHVLNLHGHKH